jgi:hypothetical protein
MKPNPALQDQKLDHILVHDKLENTQTPATQTQNEIAILQCGG